MDTTALLTVAPAQEVDATASLGQAFGDLHARMTALLAQASVHARHRALVDAADVAEHAAQAAGLTPAAVQRITTAILQLVGGGTGPERPGTTGEVAGVGGGGCAPAPGIPGGAPPPASAPLVVAAKRTRHRWTGEAPQTTEDPPRRCERCPLEEHLERTERWGRIRVYRAAGRELGRVPGGSVPVCPVKMTG